MGRRRFKSKKNDEEAASGNDHTVSEKEDVSLGASVNSASAHQRSSNVVLTSKKMDGETAAADKTVPDNLLESKGRERSTRETPFSLIKGSDTVGTSGSTTRPTNSSASDVPSPSTGIMTTELTVRSDPVDSATESSGIEHPLPLSPRDTTGAPRGGSSDTPRSFIRLAEEDAAAFMDSFLEFSKDRAAEGDDGAASSFRRFVSRLVSFKETPVSFTDTYTTAEGFLVGTDLLQRFRNLIFAGSSSLTRLLIPQPESVLDTAIVTTGEYMLGAGGYRDLSYTRETLKDVLPRDQMIIYDEFIAVILRLSVFVTIAAHY